MMNVSIPEYKLDQGSLILVNQTHPFCKRTEKDRLKNILNTQILLERTCTLLLEQLIETLNLAQAIIPVSGYRSFEDQQIIYQDTLKKRGEMYTKKYVALPGCSEHETGLAVDLGEHKKELDFIAPSFPRCEPFQRFRKMALFYGFVERYKEDKTDITGIGAEPWHFRYVSYPHAWIMENGNMALEEYILYLKKRTTYKNPLCFQLKGRCFHIFYHPCEGPITALKLPEGCIYQISGDNSAGFIVTLWR